MAPAEQAANAENIRLPTRPGIPLMVRTGALAAIPFKRSEESIVTRSYRFSITAAGLLAGLFCLCSISSQAQTGKSKAKTKPITAAELKKLDSKLEEVQGSFLRDTASIIKGYEDGGQYERAKILLEVLRKLDPKNEQIKKKLEQLDEQILDSSEFDLELDPSKGWQPIGSVTKERLIRIEVDGDYKVIATLTIGPDGVPVKDPVNDMVASAPLGAVVAMIVPPAGTPNAGGGGGGQGGQGRQQNNNAFTVGAKYEQSAARDGTLMLKVNVPQGSKCTGKLKVSVGGVLRST